MVSYRVHITDQRLFGQYLVPLRGHFRQRLTTCGFGQCLTLKTLLQSRSRPSCAPTPLPSLLGGIQPGVCSSGDVVQTDYPIIQNRIYVLQIPPFFGSNLHFRPLNPHLVYSEPHVLLLKFKLNPILASEFTHVNHVCLVASPCFADQLPSCVGSPFLLLQCPCFLAKSC